MDVIGPSTKMGVYDRCTVYDMGVREHADAAVIAAEQYEQQNSCMFSDCSHVLSQIGLRI